MPKDAWGVKRVCPSCQTRFYDLQNDPMTCPGCGAVIALESLIAGKPRAMRPEKAKPVASKDPDVLADDADADVLDDDDVDLDPDVLEEDDDEAVSLDEIADVADEDEDN